MPFNTPGGGIGGGGGGLHFRNPVDVFATNAARSTAFSAGGTAAGDHVQFAADRSLAIVIGTLLSPTSFQTYTGDAGTYDDTLWLERADAVQGLPGDDGAVGAQARFSVFGYINASTPPTTAPTGGQFIRSTGILTLPTGHTAIPTTPATTEKTYVIEALINPRVDADVVILTWPVPAELPAYLAATLAEEAETAAEAAQAAAEAAAASAVDIATGSPRGALVATSPTLPTTATANNTVIAFGAAELWTIESDAPDGFEAGPTANNERLYLPDIHPAGANGIWVVAEIDGVDIAEVFISQGGIQGATGADRRHMLPVSVTADALVRIGFWQRSTVASYIQITGNADTLPANTVIKVYLAVVRGAPGGGLGGGLTEADVDALIAAALAAAVTGNTESGIVVTYSAEKLNFVVSGGNPNPPTDDIYFGLSADATAESAEFTIPAVNGSGTISAYVGNMHHLIARLASEEDITSVLYSDDPTQTNEIGAFTKSTGTIVPPGETLAFNVWVSNQALTQSADVIISVA